ncbi:hypothetical protein MFIFM68171_02899 [Madurella fahalii]|uniref:Uncharacterized protein n=1 Tax=Madurella fahalii TaxID=1157608 RepID=A0ABQ0G4V5_9PEZI
MAFHFTTGNSTRSYAVAYTVLVGIILLAVIPFALLSLSKNKSRRDPARRFVPWLKISFWLFCLTLSLLLAQFIITTCATHNVDIGSDTLRAGYHLGYLAELFRALSAAAIMVFLFVLGAGITYALHGAPGSFDRMMRYAAYFLGFVIAALAITYYGLLVDFHVNFTNLTGTVNNGRGPSRIETINDLIGATSIILFVASLAIAGLAISCAARSRTSPLRSTSILYLVAGLLNLLSSSWAFAYAIEWLLETQMWPQEPYVVVLTIILEWWSRGLLLIAAFFIAAKGAHSGGVWSGSAKGGSSMHFSPNRASYNSGAAFV